MIHIYHLNTWNDNKLCNCGIKHLFEWFRGLGYINNSGINIIIQALSLIKKLRYTYCLIKGFIWKCLARSILRTMYTHVITMHKNKPFLWPSLLLFPPCSHLLLFTTILLWLGPLVIPTLHRSTQTREVSHCWPHTHTLRPLSDTMSSQKEQKSLLPQRAAPHQHSSDRGKKDDGVRCRHHPRQIPTSLHLTISIWASLSR